MDKNIFSLILYGTLTDIQTGIPVPSALETIKKLQDKYILSQLRQDVPIINKILLRCLVFIILYLMEGCFDL